jgi:Fe-S cluster assembly ATPase SufC
MARICWRWNRKNALAAGVFLAFQYPVELPGVFGNATFLRTALECHSPRQGRERIGTPCNS